MADIFTVTCQSGCHCITRMILKSNAIYMLWLKNVLIFTKNIFTGSTYTTQPPCSKNDPHNFPMYLCVGLSIRNKWSQLDQMEYCKKPVNFEEALLNQPHIKRPSKEGEEITAP